MPLRQRAPQLGVAVEQELLVQLLGQRQGQGKRPEVARQAPVADLRHLEEQDPGLLPQTVSTTTSAPSTHHYIKAGPGVVDKRVMEMYSNV